MTLRVPVRFSFSEEVVGCERLAPALVCRKKHLSSYSVAWLMRVDMFIEPLICRWRDLRTTHTEQLPIKILQHIPLHLGRNQIANKCIGTPEPNELCLMLLTGIDNVSDQAGILYTWTGSGKLVCAGMYWNVLVCTGTCKYRNFFHYVLVCNGMYQKHDIKVSHTSRQLSESKL